MNNDVIIFIVTVYSAVVLYAGCSLVKTRAALEEKIAELEAERQRLTETEAQTLEFVDKVVPLIEKTSWDIYWKAGNGVRALTEESSRNQKVEIARKALWKIPLVRDHIRNTTGATK
jgi:hypothetical protein